jgi:uncharacterized C2H2 Zn-finger protein
MAPAQKTKSVSRTRSSLARKAESSGLKCPECGRSFDRPASLGAHRRRAHGIVGQSAAASRSRLRRSTSATVARNNVQATDAPTSETAHLDPDGLLRILFPQGLPARRAVIRAANAWLEEAERLVRL